MFGGVCTNASFVSEYFDRNQGGPCQDCRCFRPEDWVCEVIAGQETVFQGECIIEMVQYEEVLVPIGYRKRKKR